MTDEQISQFMGLTNASHDIAEQYLARNGYDVSKAVNDYSEDPVGRAATPESDSHPGASRSSARGFGGGPRVRTMAELMNEGAGDGGFSDDDEDNDERNYFTGGEKSGLQVENPEDARRRAAARAARAARAGGAGGSGGNGSGNPMSLVEDLLKKAQEEAGKPDTREPIEQPEAPKFSGSGFKLGSEENHITSQKIVDPAAAAAERSRIPGKVTRTITFWKEGFQVDDGKLYRYDDPENAEYLKQLNQGRAPLSLLNVEMFQDVDVHVIKKLDESYVPPKVAPGGFHGEGHRLGSPVPGEPIVIGGQETAADTDTDAAAAAGSPVPATETAATTKAEALGASSGDTRVQIRLADGGKRLVHSFDSTDPVSVIYDYVEANTESTGREWRLALAFPLQFLDDKKDQTIAEAGLKNAVIVQRWK